MQDKGYYLYAIAWSKEMSESELTGTGVDAISPLESVGEGDISAIISEVSLSEFGVDALRENFKNLAWVEEKVRRYDMIIRELAERLTLVPVRFGTIFLSRENVESVLKANYDRFLANLTALKGRWEMGLTISFDKDKMSESVITHNDDLQALKKRIDASMPGAAYLLKRKLESSQSTAVDSLISEQIDKILASLRQVCADVKPGSSAAKEAEKHVFQWKAACLVEQDTQEHARKVLTDAVQQADEGSAAFRITGPWPPYSFASWQADSGQEVQ